jgi:hypothetical protein
MVTTGGDGGSASGKGEARLGTFEHAGVLGRVRLTSSAAFSESSVVRLGHANAVDAGGGGAAFGRTARYAIQPTGRPAELELTLDAHGGTEPPTRKRWAWLFRQVFQADLDTCVRCGGPMRWVEAAATRETAGDLLARLGLAP